MKWVRGEGYHPYEYRFFEGGGFPATLTHDGLTARLRTSFRIWLRFDQLIQSGKICDQERLKIAFDLCLENLDPEFPLEALSRGLLWFHGADAIDRSWIFNEPKRAKHKQLYEKMLNNESKKSRSLSLFWDSKAIWSAFRASFGIDLFQADLHWWAFLALMNELPENCSVSRLIRQRTTDIKDVNEKERGEFVIRQHLASLPAGGILEGDHGKL